MTTPEIAAYYFPSYHREPRNDEWYSPGFTEWELVEAGRPRFDGHRQPLKPVWGFFDESIPENMERSSTTAKRHGIDAFLFDWYWYENKPFLNGALDRGYLGIEDPEVSFALMWANHHWQDVFPARTERDDAGRNLQFMSPATVTPDEFVALSDDWIRRYLSHPKYWRIRGGAYVSIFAMDLFAEWMGGDEATRDVLDDFRARSTRAGTGDLHLAVPGGITLDPEAERLTALGLDSYTSYNWLTELDRSRGMQVPYADWRAAGQAQWEPSSARVPIPYAPNVTMGWDSTTRVHQDDENIIGEWPFLPVVIDNEPEQFGDSIADAIDFSRADSNSAGYITVNAWNEWTEGSYLEPEESTGMAYLEAVQRAIARTSSAD